jgi:predicted nucleic acid-binding protein
LRGLSESLKGIVLDSSILIELLAGSKTVEDLAKTLIKHDILACATRLGLVESLYITCRLWGFDKALTRILLLMDSQVVEIIEIYDIWQQIADCKCKISISLGDCATLAAAKRFGLMPMFLHEEKELLEAKEKIVEWLGTKPFYLL